MIKKILIVVIILGALMGAAIVGLYQAKPWVMKTLKKKIMIAAEAKSVTLKDISYSLRGPIVITGLEIKKTNDLTINISDITVNKGLWGIWDGATGVIHVKSAQANQLKLTNIAATFWWSGNNMIIQVEDGRVLNGSLKGEISVQLNKEPLYDAKLNLGTLSLPQFTQDFKLKDKVQITGLLTGDVRIKGQGKTFDIIDGKLNAATAGGELIITDTQYLDAMAKRTGQSLDLIVAGLKHYLYNKGLVTLMLKEGNLHFDIALAGENGKRNLTVVLHDFNLERFGL